MERTYLTKWNVFHSKTVKKAAQLVRSRMSNLNNIKQIEQSLVTQERNAQQAFRTLVIQYRRDNRKARQENEKAGPVPAHWTENIQPLDLDERDHLDENLEAQRARFDQEFEEIKTLVEGITQEAKEEVLEERKTREAQYKAITNKKGSASAITMADFQTED